MAAAGKLGVLKIYKIADSHDLNNRTTINPNPYKEYKNCHDSDILDINWNTKNLNLVLTASTDQKVIIYNINIDRPIQILTHPDMVSSACFKIGVRLNKY